MRSVDDGGWRHRRKLLALNQSDFWSRVGVEQSVGSRYEAGRELPRPLRLLLELAYGQTAMADEIFRNLRACASDLPLSDQSRLRAYRLARGLSLGQFWSPLGIQRSVASRYETSRQAPRQVLMLLTLAYGAASQAEALLASLRSGVAPLPDAGAADFRVWTGERRQREERRKMQIPLPAWQEDRRRSSDRRLPS